MKRYILLFLLLLALIVPVNAQSLDETLTLDLVGVSISYPSGWISESSSALGFTIKENADDSNIFSATGMYIQGNVRGDSLVPGDALDDRIATFIASNELMEVEAEIRSTDAFEYGYAVLDTRQFILISLGGDFLMVQIATPVRPLDDPLVMAIIESITTGDDGTSPPADTSDTPDEDSAQPDPTDETVTAIDPPAANEDGFIPISYDDALRGKITQDNNEVLYIFTGEAGDSVTLTMIADDTSVLDTTLWLYPLSEFDINAHIGYNDDSAESGTTNSQIIATLPETGDYIIKATNFSGAGDYVLTLTSEEVTMTEVTYGTSIEGELPDDNTGDFYRFMGSAGDEVTISMIADDSDELDTKLALYLSGTSIAENDDSNEVGFPNSQIVVTLPEDGEYLIEATRFDGFGPYTLSVESDGVVVLPETTDEVETTQQWAISATASSEYGNPDWGAMRATGAPDVEGCTDSVNAWASADGNGEETLSLMFADAVQPTQVNIHQNLRPGSIVRVELIEATTGETIEIPDSADPGDDPCPRVFTLDITGVDATVNGVVIHLDESIGGYWNEIDAVELVGVAGEAEAVEVILPNTIADTQAATSNFSLDYPAAWVAANIGPNMLLAADSQATVDMATSDTVSLDTTNAYAFVADVATIVDVSSGDLETINAAVLEAITMDPEDSYGETEIITSDDGHTIYKTYTTADGAEGYMYVTMMNDTVIGMQGVAGDITTWEMTFDAMFASIVIDGN